MRRAGRGQKYQYFYIGHYNLHTKKKDWCQIKGYRHNPKAGLADIEFIGPMYQEYKSLLEKFTRHYWQSGYGTRWYDTEELNLISKLCQLLREFGWPARWAYTKLIEDWKNMSQKLQSGCVRRINRLDKEKRQARKEYKKTISEIVQMLLLDSIGPTSS